VLVLGNSIAAGLGVSSQAAFPARLQQTVDSLGWNVTVQNAGVSGETTAGGRSRIGWLLNEEVDVLVLELGGNDGLRGVDLQSTKENLTAIIDTTLAVYPKARVLLSIRSCRTTASTPPPPDIVSWRRTCGKSFAHFWRRCAKKSPREPTGISYCVFRIVSSSMQYEIRNTQ